MALRGIKVIEMAGLAPAPFCGMILADFGANVIRIDKVKHPVTVDVLGRGKRSIAIDLKQELGVGILKRLCAKADVLIDSFRPGVMERLGVGPSQLQRLNSRLIYARLSGYGQSGPSAPQAGHDINYLAMSGVLSRLGRAHERPYAPVNMLADFAGGGMTCALGIILALYERTHSNKGQVIDCSMVEGSAYIGSWLWRSKDLFVWGKERGKNWLDGGAAFYDTYECKDGKFISVGTVEPEFFHNFIQAVGLSEDTVASQSMDDQEGLRDALKGKFLERCRDDWMEYFRGKDVCVEAVLSLEEASKHPHATNRSSFIEGEPGPAPHLSRTPGSVSRIRDPLIGEHSAEVLRECEYSDEEMERFIEDGVVEQGNGSTAVGNYWSKL